MPSTTDQSSSTRARRLWVTLGIIAVVAVGGVLWLTSLEEDTPASGSTKAAAGSSGADAARFEGLVSYVDTHTAALVAETGKLEVGADAYAKLVVAADGDYAALATDDAEGVRTVLGEVRAAWQAANPAYEEMEGVVAGVPSLARYDVSIDAGAPVSEDAENAVDFDVKVSDDLTLEQAGNYFLLSEATIYGTEPAWSSGVAFDVDADGTTTGLGDALPKADVLQAIARDFHAEAEELQSAATAWKPNNDDAFNAIVTMTPTMSEYFESWKNSSFVLGDRSRERGFTASSRLIDVVGILSGLEVIRDAVSADIEQADPAAARSIDTDLNALIAFVTDLKQREAAGTKFTPAQADRFGADAQAQAEQIAAQVTDVARDLGIKIEA
ncbi:MAG: hypothetical protein JWN72_2230 [Thermoleophilia bacterium]|nr:hypothetical protein [Thermoleophilia bacterium]